MRRLVVLVALLMPLVLLSQPASAEYHVPVGATFNTPHPWGGADARSKIVRTVEEAFRHVRPTRRDPRPTILIAAYLFDRKASADALIAACRRKVSVRVIIDRDVSSKPFRRLVTALNSDNVKDRNHDGVADSRPRSGPCNRKRRGSRPMPLMSAREARASIREPLGTDVRWGKDRSYVLQCSGSCRGGDKANMHAKIYAFTHTGKSKWVTMMASTNLNGGGINTGWNDLFVLKDRPRTFAFVERVHRLMTRQKRAGRELVQLKDGPYTTRFFPMRDVGKRRDPLMRDLRKVRCTSRLGRTSIHIQQFWWNGRRGNYIWEKLRNLALHGCNVNIILGATDRGLRSRMITAAHNGVVDLWDSRIDTDGDGFYNTRTHMKSLVIRGTYGRDRSYWGVWTGTANWATGSLNRGDENTINIAKRSAWKRYVKQWGVVRNHSRRL
jgi:hypothetical protein